MARTTAGARKGRVTERDITVQAKQGEFKVFTIDAQGKKAPLGTLMYRDYDEDRRLRVPVLNGDRVLGRASSQYKVVDHLTAVAPVQEYGFSPRTIHHFRGGSELIAFFSTDDPSWQFKDPVAWDQEMYGVSEGLFLALKVHTSMRVGNAIRYAFGFWRQICVNGLVAECLNLGVFRVAHTAFDHGEVVDWMGECLEAFDQKQMTFDTISTKALSWPTQAITTLVADVDAGDAYIAGQPNFARRPLSKVRSRLPTWGLESLSQQLEMAKSAKKVSKVDLLNMLTSVSNSSPRHSEDNPIAWEVYRRMDPLASNLTELVEIGAFKAGVKGFPS